MEKEKCFKAAKMIGEVFYEWVDHCPSTIQGYECGSEDGCDRSPAPTCWANWAMEMVEKGK